MKRIRSRSDLAINGAAPAYAEPLHVGRPNIGDKRKYLRIAEDILERRWLSNDGPLVQKFELELASFLGVKHVVAMCNGTIALEIAIRALGLTGEVIVPSFTFVATAHAVSWQGVTPVFADIDPETHCLAPDAVRRAITPRTSGVVGVHLWGHPAPVEELEEICRERNLKLMFDAAHAFGVSRGNRMIGGFGSCEVFSFHATKFLNSFEGGAAATNDDQIADTMRLMRNFGFRGYDNVIYHGTNGKMVEPCAAMGLVNLASIDEFVKTNRRNHRCYAEGLSGLKGVKLIQYDEAERNNWQYVVAEVDESFGTSRDEVIKALHAENILARRYFWPGSHKMQPYRELYPWADTLLPHTKAVAEKVVVLPTGTAIKESDVDTVCSVFRSLQLH